MKQLSVTCGEIQNPKKEIKPEREKSYIISLAFHYRYLFCKVPDSVHYISVPYLFSVIKMCLSNDLCHSIPLTHCFTASLQVYLNLIERCYQ